MDLLFARLEDAFARSEERLAKKLEAIVGTGEAGRLCEAPFT